MTLWLILALTQAAQPAPKPGEGAPEEVVIQGKAQERKPPLGSRIARPAEPDYRGFVSQIASDTGVAGLGPGSGMDPFAGPTRKLKIRTCKAGEGRTGTIACHLAKAKGALDAGRAADALPWTDKVIADPTSTAEDRHDALLLNYQTATIGGDAEGRRDALRGLLTTGLLAPEQRRGARQALAVLALGAGDRDEAVLHYSELVREAPDNARAQGNLGVLYAQAGAHGLARTHLGEAVRLAELSGQAVPEGWRDYLANPR